MTKRINNKPRLKKKGYAILTHREVEILSMVAVGFSNRDVAEELCISHHTVKWHLRNVFKKISVPNRLQAALWSVKNL